MDDRLSCTEVIPCEKLFLEDSENIVPEEFFFQNDNNVKGGIYFFSLSKISIHGKSLTQVEH